MLLEPPHIQHGHQLSFFNFLLLLYTSYIPEDSCTAFQVFQHFNVPSQGITSTCYVLYRMLRIISNILQKTASEILVYRGGNMPETGLPWFTEDRDEAAKYGLVRAYYITVENPASVEHGFLPSVLQDAGYDAAKFDNPMSREGNYGNQAPQWVPLSRDQIRIAPEII